MASLLLLAPALLLALFPSAGASSKAGLSLGLTEKCLNYATKTIPEVLKKVVHQYPIPRDIPLNNSAVRVHLINATVEPLIIHYMDISPCSSPSSLEISVSLDVHGTTHFTSHIPVVDLHDHGLINFKVTDVNITVAVNLVPGKNGKWIMSFTESHSSVGDIELVFVEVVHSIIIQLIRPLLISVVKKQLQTILNQMFPPLITKANEILADKLPIINVRDGFGINLGLTAKAVFATACYASLPLSGLATYLNHTYGQVLPLPPSKPSCDGYMISAQISVSTFKSLLLAASTPANKFHYTKNTGFAANDSVLAIIFPEIAKHSLTGALIASGSLELGDITLGRNHVSLSLTGEGDILANTPHGKEPIAVVKLLVGVTVEADIGLVNLPKPVNGSIQAIILENIHVEANRVTVKSSAVGPAETELMREMLRGAIIQHQKELDAFGRKGINIPTTPLGALKLQLEVYPKYMEVFADLSGPIEMEGVHASVERTGLTGMVRTVIGNTLQQVFLRPPARKSKAQKVV